MQQLTLVRVHEPDAVREILETAWQLVEESTVPEGLRIEAFEQACALLGARVPIMPMPEPIVAPYDLLRR